MIVTNPTIDSHSMSDGHSAGHMTWRAKRRTLRDLTSPVASLLYQWEGHISNARDQTEKSEYPKNERHHH